ncbi:MAG: autotransporter outer membrane beta-barrel domain-containing protein [Rhodanobacter sp.]
MNIIYRIVWNAVRQGWAVASEMAKGRTKSSTSSASRRRGASVLALSAVLMTASTSAADITYVGTQTLRDTWGKAASWAGGVVPGINDRAIISGPLNSIFPTGAPPVGSIWITSSSGLTTFNQLASTGAVTIYGIGGVGVQSDSSNTINFFRRANLAGDISILATNSAGGGFNFDNTNSGAQDAGLHLGTHTVTFDTVNAVNTMNFRGNSGIYDAGNVVKTGQGQLVLQGLANNTVYPTTLFTYTGSTSILQGTLALIGIASLASSSNVLVNGIFDISATADGQYDTLGTPGGTSINTLTGNGTIELGARNLRLAADGNVFSGVINGTGKLILADGTTTLTGANTYSGGTELQQGRVNVGYNSTLGTGALAMDDGTTLGFVADGLDVANGISLTGTSGNVDTSSFNETLSGTISGAALLDKEGGGVLTLTGANTYTGTTTISAGTLQLGNGGTTGSIITDVTANGTLAFDRSDDISFGNAISGSGGIHQFGAGRTNLTADNSSFSGATSVTGGALAVNGTLGDATSTVDVSNGGILAGAGTIGGSVTIADGHLAPGNSPGTLTINGDLSLGAASNLDYELGAASVAGGPLNDLVEVGGNLTLDGTLNVIQSAGGTYGAGIYRLIDYSGTLTDNGLELGSMPASTDNYVQTSIDHQVNLVNSQGLVLNYWDGDAGPKNNGVINGGNGTWLAAPGNDNWTEVSGTINAPYQDAAFAIFAGAAGTVNVDDSMGAINVSGMQFATDGYLVEGDAINLTAGTNAIRVGDGAAAGAGITATIASELTGPGKLDKVDLGTLILTGNNTYIGGTTISDGILQLGDGGTSGSVTGDIIDNGTLAIDRSDAVTLDAITGTGGIDQIGSGTTTLTGSSTYTGATHVDAGTLAAGVVHAFSATSTTTVAAGATLDLAGFSQDVASLNNSGTVSLSGTTPGATLTVHGDYVGQNGVLRMDTALGDNASVTDRLVIDGGSASGHTAIQLSNLGGLGALTSGDGIELVSAINGATTTVHTTADAFALAGGHVDAGAFEYRLYAGDAANAGENWYLRSSTDTPPPVDGDGGGVVTYRPEAALYASVAGLLRQADLGMLGDLHRRVGDDNTVAGTNGDSQRAWARVISQDLQTSHIGTVSPSTDGTLQGVQAGVDLVQNIVGDGSYRAGLYGGQLRDSSRAWGFASAVENSRVGDLNLRSSYVGAYGTYTANAGWYADAVLQQGWHSGRANVLSGQRDDAGGKSTQASLELGKDTQLSAHWLLEPQVQFIVDHLSVDTQKISGATITQPSSTTLTSRLGVRLKGSYPTSQGQIQPYARINIWHGSVGSDSMEFAGPAGSTTINSERGYSSGELAGGLTWMINPRFSLYGEVGRVYSLDDTIGAQSRSTFSASAGLRVNW